MKNIGITKVFQYGVDDFTSPIGLKLRRLLNPLLRRLIHLGTRRKIIVEQYPELEDGKPYIFASTHYFDDDIISAVHTIDRNAYILAGTTNQIEYNPQMYAAWLNGMIYVDRLDKQNRKDSVEKMKKVLASGSSILIYPEGGWNNTENLLIQPLFASPYILYQETGCPVVPLASFHEYGGDKVYVRAAEPLFFDGVEKAEALRMLRDSLATMMYEMIEAHCSPLMRDSLRGDHHLAFMEERRQEYLRVKWTRDVWDEELAFYHDKEHPRPEEVWEFVDHVRITPKNAAILAPILVRREEDKKYDFLRYMHENWDK